MPRFEKGNNHSNGKGGRPKNSRNKLCRAVVEDLLNDWADGGAAAIKIMRMEDPSAYVRAMVSIIPKEILFQSGMADLDDDSLDELIVHIRERLLVERQEQALELKTDEFKTDELKMIQNGKSP